MPNEQDLVELVTRGLSAVQERHGQMSERLIGVEFQLVQVNKTLQKVETDLSNAQTERLKLRVEALEKTAEEQRRRQDENVKWFKGLLASVILLLIGFLFNFVRLSLR